MQTPHDVVIEVSPPSARSWLLTPPAWLTATLLGTAVLALIAVSVLPLISARRAVQTRDRIERAETIALLTDHLEAALAREVASLRGFLLTGDTVFLGRVEEARARQSVFLADMQPLADNAPPPIQPVLLDVMRQARAWRGTQTPEDVRSQQRQYDALLARTAALRNDVDRMIGDLRAEIRAGEGQTRILLVGGSGAALLCLLVLAWFAVRASRLAAAVQASERRFRSTFEHAAVGIAHVGTDGRWLRVNARLCEILGYTPDQLRDRTFQDLTHPADLAADLELTGRLLRNEIPSFEMQKRYLRPDGSAVWCNLTAAVVRTPDGRPEYGIAVLEDIDDRVRLEQERAELLHLESGARAAAEREAERHRLLQDITSALSSAVAREDVAAVVVDRVVAALGAEYGFLALPSDDGAFMEIIGPARLPEPISGDWSRFPIRAPIPLTRAYHSGHPVFIETHDGTDHVADPGLRDTLERLGIRAGAVLPLRLGNRSIGAMTFDFTVPRRFDAVDRELLDLIAQKVAQALDRARLFAAERERAHEARVAADRLHRLQSVTAALTGALTREAVASVLAKQGRDALGGHAGAVALLSRDATRLEFVGWDGYPADSQADWQGMPVTIDTPLTAAVRAGVAQWLGNRGEWEERFGPVPVVTRMLRSRAWAAVPLVFGDRVLGAFVVSYVETRTFDAADRALGTAIAQLGAQALERARLYEEADTARIAAESGVRSRDRFLAATSHELRGPLSELIGSLDAFPEHSATDSDAAAQARAAAWRFAAIVDSMLALADPDSAAGRVGEEQVDVAAVVRQLVAAFEPIAAKQNRGLRLVDAGAPLLTFSDPRKLRPIVHHLLDNAVKFGARGPIVMTVQTDAREIRVSVRDQGPGIAADDLDAIFEPFTQLQGGHTRERGGAGIGLALCRRFARQLGGNLTVVSEPGAGSTFTLHLVRRDVTAADARDDAGARLLVVDDEDAIRGVVLRALRREGFVVEGRSSAADALSLLERDPFDLVLTDISMPGQTGLWLADRIRGRWPHTAVILMSGAELATEELEHAARLGCPFISKPFEPRTLAATVKGALASHTRVAGD